MDMYTATEVSYKNGYEAGVKKFAIYLKNHSFLCDSKESYSFNAIDEDELDDLVKDFLRDLF